MEACVCWVSEQSLAQQTDIADFCQTLLNILFSISNWECGPDGRSRKTAHCYSSSSVFQHILQSKQNAATYFGMYCIFWYSRAKYEQTNPHKNKEALTKNMCAVRWGWERGWRGNSPRSVLEPGGFLTRLLHRPAKGQRLCIGRALGWGSMRCWSTERLGCL